MTGPSAGTRRRVTGWVVTLGVLVVGATLLVTGASSGSTPLDPDSTAGSGSRALRQMLAGYGVRLLPTSSLATAGDDPARAVVVLAPEAYSDGQLRTLARSVRRLVLVEPGLRAAHAVTTVEPDTDEDAAASSDPACALPGARAAGYLDLPGTGTIYTGTGRLCYGGLVAVSGRVVVLGSSQLLRNDHLAREGVAALDVNLLSADRTASSVVWLRPGADARGSGPASVWDVFPSGAHRAFVWLLVVAALLLLWRGRRLGAAVTEPLPVIVRSAELVEGHGRLYRRAHARDRAARALRAGALHRLARRVALPATASAEQVVAALAARPDVDAAAAWTALAGPDPVDDRQLVALADDLTRLEQLAQAAEPGPPSMTKEQQ